MSKFRKKPVVINAVQWNGSNLAEITAFTRSRNMNWDPTNGISIHTLEGNMHASNGDWIIEGVNGEFYPCKPEIFEKTYEAVDSE